MNPVKSKQQAESLLADIRLVVSASLPDEELELKAEAVEQELEAIDQALADEGTYLGIVDKGELDKRKEFLEIKLTLLKQERDYLHALNVALREEESCNATEGHGLYSTAGNRQPATSRRADVKEDFMDCEHDRGRGTETAEVSVPPVPDMYACAHTRGVWASMTATARTAHRRMVRAAKQAVKRKEASLEDQASVGAVAIAKRNAATATRRAMAALSLKTSLLAQLTAADSAIIQTAHEATLAGRALDSERCSASRILAARQHWSDQDICSPFSRNPSSLRWHCTSPAEPPTGLTSLAASSPERLGSPPHYACWPTPAESCGASEDDRYGAIYQQLAPSRPADTKEELPSYEPEKGSGTDTSEGSAPSMPGKYCWTHTPAIWAGMTATARCAHSEVVRAAKEAANLEQESLEHQASADAVAIAKRNVATAVRRAGAAVSLKDSLRAQLAAAESTVIQTADKATVAGQALDSEKRRASRILADRWRLSNQDPSHPPSWRS